jgi:twitching motility protein PilT
MNSTLAEIVRLGLSAKASDWHLQRGQPLALTVYGEIQKVSDFVVTEELIGVLLADHTPEVLRNRFLAAPEHALDASDRLGGENFRLHFEAETTYEGRTALTATLRHIPSIMPSMDDLGLPVGFQNLVKNPPPNGLIIVSGATGSGKSTTLAAAMHHINQHCAKKIITLEAPIEYFHRPLRCQIVHRSVGIDVPSFKAGIEQILRAKPNIILVGEMRDLDTISAALSAAETGHLVFGTLHTNNAPSAINRVLDVVPEGSRDQYRSQLAQGLKAILCQRLAPRVGGGLVAAYEFMANTPAISSQIRENKIGQLRGTISTGQQHHMHTMNQSLKRLVNEKRITRETALEFSDNRLELEADLRGSF